MDPAILCRELEELVERVGVEVRYEALDDMEVAAHSGLCTIKGHRVLLVDSDLPLMQRVAVLARCLINADTQDIYIKPVVREYVDQLREKEKRVDAEMPIHGGPA